MNVLGSLGSARASWSFAAVAAVLAGCSAREAEPTYVPMGKSAPELGSASAPASLPGFIVGRWCRVPVSDKTFAKQIGVQAIVEAEKPDPRQWFEFSNDGTFKHVDEGSDFMLRGKWVANSETVRLSYETFNDTPPFERSQDRPLSQAREEARQREPGSANAARIGRFIAESDKLTLLRLAPDRKRLLFVGAGPPMDLGGLIENASSLPPLGAPGLERMKPERAKN